MTGSMQVTVFGLDLSCDRELPFLAPAEAAPTGRPLEMTVLDGDAAALEWPEDSEVISNLLLPDGTVSFQIEAAGEAGYRIWSPTHGFNVLSRDGRELRSVPGPEGFSAWQRFLISQVLPFAAVLHGLEVLHASAVVLDGKAAAFTGRSGVGKTSVALALWREEGAQFLADDVLALEGTPDGLLGHPGSPISGIDRLEAERVRKLSGEPLPETLSVDAREEVTRIPLSPERAPVGSIFFLDRRPDGPAEPSFEPGIDVPALLASTFNFVLSGPERLEGLLDACAALAHGRVERVSFGPEVDATALGAAVARRVGAEP